MKRFLRASACIFICGLLILATLLTGCRKDSNAHASAPSGSAVILDGKKYSGKFAVWFFYVKKSVSTENTDAGDTILLRSPDGKTMMIDTGYSDTISPILDDIKKIGVTKLDYLVLTHMHTDHNGGVSTVLNAMPVETVLASRFAFRNVGSAPAFIKALDSKGMKPDIVKEGDTISFGKNIKVEVLNPVDGTYEIPNDSYSNQDTVNENSVVLKTTYGKNVFLFTGDIQHETEQRLVEKYAKDIHADLIKVPHHGYDTSSSREFVKSVTPKYAVIPQCVMPRLNIYQRYQTAGCKVYVTGLDGIVLAVSDGKNINIVTEKKRAGGLKP